MKFNGYASVTEVPYDMGFYDETVARGAFKKSLSENPDVQMLINHGHGGSGMPIARTGRNMTLQEEYKGLAVDADLDPEDPDVQLLARKMDSGLLDQMSFSFIARRSEFNSDFTARRIIEADIHRGDVSPVNQGASPTTSMGIRNLRASIAAAGGRSSLPQRKELAAAIGNVVVVELRSVTLGGHRYDLRGANGGEDRAAHEKYTGTHSHAHSALGSQGGDATHSHAHTHDHDANHDHPHGATSLSKREYMALLVPDNTRIVRARLRQLLAQND